MNDVVTTDTNRNDIAYEIALYPVITDLLPCALPLMHDLFGIAKFLVYTYVASAL